MRSATRSSRIMSRSVLPSTYSEWLRDRKTRRVEVGLAAELHDALRDLVGVRLLLVRVLQELGLDRFGVNSLRHEVVALVAQHAHDLGGERLVQDLAHRRRVGSVAGRDRAFLDVLARTLAQRLYVGQEWRRLRRQDSCFRLACLLSLEFRRYRGGGARAPPPRVYPLRASDIRNVTIAMIRNAKNRILAIPAAPAAMPPKPNSAATSAITKNTIA